MATIKATIMSKPKVLVTSSDTPQLGLEILRATCEVTVLPQVSPTREQVLKVLPGYNAVFLSTHHNVNSEFLEAAGPNLKVISTMSAGYDHLDVPEIKRRGIQVGHTPEVTSAAVAEVAVMLMLNAARRAHEGRILLQAEKVEKRPQWLLGYELRDSTVGIVGLGGIGQAIVKRLRGFDIGKFLYTGHSKKKAGDELEVEFVSLDDLLQNSDFVIVAVPLTTETKGLFNNVTFNKMKSNAILVNVGRGAVVDTPSLLQALKEKRIFAAGLDVTDPEPLPKDHELFKLPNFEIIPHLGTATVKTRNEMSTVTAQNIINGLNGKDLIYPL